METIKLIPYDSELQKVTKDCGCQMSIRRDVIHIDYHFLCMELDDNLGIENPKEKIIQHAIPYQSISRISVEFEQDENIWFLFLNTKDFNDPVFIRFSTSKEACQVGNKIMAHVIRKSRKIRIFK